MNAVPDDVAELVKAAQGGDDDAYGQLVAPHRVELHAHCYRMLGSNSDAEDALQETLVRAWRGMGRFEGRSSVRAWLYRIATNACLRLLEGRSARVLATDFSPAADPHGERSAPVAESVWIEPYPTPELGYEQRESVELAFIAALQHLPPAQRAALILRDVLAFSAAETASMLGTSPTAVYSLLQRAHKTVAERVPSPSQQATLQALGDHKIRALADRFMAAWEGADVQGIVALLTEDATFSMPPLPEWYSGRAAIGEFLSLRPLASMGRWRMTETRANGQLAFGHYMWDDSAATFLPHSIDVLDLRGEHIAAATAYFRSDLFPEFGLPAVHVDPRAARSSW